MNKKTIFLVPHSHWDREWYFTSETSNVLFNHNMIDALKQHTNQKWFLDGQWSLIDDFLKWNPNKKSQITELIKNGYFSSGPLYTQPDVFNSLAETIFRNFEIGDSIAKNLGVKQLKTAYMPDTFGFGKNLPQIFKKSGIENFVFWRGLSKDFLNKSHSFVWKGIDGSKVNAFVMNEGYYSLGMYFPYNGDKFWPEKNDPKYFLEKVTKRIKNVNTDSKNIILPLGGDQAPFMHSQVNFINKVNEISNDYEFKLVNNFDVFFNDFNANYIYSEELRYPISGKIHRTISSSRYDIKSKFRNIERKLFYTLEPLEIMYKFYDANYEFEAFKNENILKPLLIAQTHDSLGACNTDITNALQNDRLEKIEQNIDSQIDLLIKKIIQEKNISENNEILLNTAPFKNSIFEIKEMYSEKFKEINFENESHFFKTLSSKNIAIGNSKSLYKMQVLTQVKNIDAFSFNVIELRNEELNKKINSTITKLRFENEFIIFENMKIRLISCDDNGDSYDSDPLDNLEFANNHRIISSVKTLGNDEFIEVESKLNNTIITWNIFIEDNNIKINLSIKNNLEKSRVSLEVYSGNGENISKSQNLAITKFADETIPIDWKELGYSEKPLNVDINDGLIILNDLKIATNGNNEFYKKENGISLTLYRTYDYVTGDNLTTRPTTSGLSWFEPSNDSKLLKELNFEINFSLDEQTKVFNRNYFKPRTYVHQNKNFIANKLTKFVINDIQSNGNQVNDMQIFDKKFLISSFRNLDGITKMRLSNPSDEVVDYLGTKIKPYEIFEVVLKGQKWIKN